MSKVGETMEITSFNGLRSLVRENNQVKIVIAMADEEEVLLADAATKEGIAKFILIGAEERIQGLFDKHELSRENFEVINECDHKQAAIKAMKMVKQQQADIPMKGLLHTSEFMGAVLNKEYGFERTKRISQITIFQDQSNTLTFLTDCAINIEQSLSVKKDIIENAVLAARLFGIPCPKVALLSAVETINEKMPDTTIGAVLVQMNNRGQIKDCLIDGPLSLDNAISKEAATIKGIRSSVAGAADILVGSSLQEANTLSKALNFYAGFETASILLGTKEPFIMTSRTDTLQNKVNSIAATCWLYQKQNSST
ncbi:phosphate acyltransferase [Enterococcus sp. AZ135]|uniref:phosphate acyltransferase n=2 Tax=Enterococcus TaxID=1350 RepID=UPI003F682C9A